MIELVGYNCLIPYYKIKSLVWNTQHEQASHYCYRQSILKIVFKKLTTYFLFYDYNNSSSKKSHRIYRIIIVPISIYLWKLQFLKMIKNIYISYCIYFSPAMCWIFKNVCKRIKHSLTVIIRVYILQRDRSICKTLPKDSQAKANVIPGHLMI